MCTDAHRMTESPLDGKGQIEMRVVRQTELGGTDVLEVVEVERPEPGPTEILVRVHAAGVNPVDWKTREHGVFLGTPPFVLGWDVSGTVEHVGFGVSWLKPGDEVLGMPLFPKEAGGYGEYVVAPSRQFVRKPAELSHFEAAALPLAGLTAWQALVDDAQVQPGQRVLVHAAAGGVGHLAVQIAKARGAYVYGTARTVKHEFLRSIAVDEPIDYTTADFTQVAKDVDVVFDLIGGDNAVRSVDVLKPGGTVFAVPGGVDEELAAKAAQRGVRATGILVEPDQRGLQGLLDLIAEGKLTVRVDQVLPLAEAGKAHELGAANQLTGKLVLDVLGH
jgi:NADPH:quinone reductase-like Zn-dependent oxidoreductase